MFCVIRSSNAFGMTHCVRQKKTNKKVSGPYGTGHEKLNCCSSVTESFIATALNMWTLKQTYSSKFWRAEVILSQDKGVESNHKFIDRLLC